MLRLFALLLTLITPAWAQAQDFSALREPGAMALMRHALAPGTGDPGNFRLGDCSTQRNLDARGRDQARRIGAALRAAGIPFDQVWTSQWCRCVDTATLLGLGPVTETPPLNSFFRNRDRADQQTQDVRAALRAVPDTQRVMLVTHQVNITALTGVFPSSGEIIVIRLNDENGIDVLDRIEIAP